MRVYFKIIETLETLQTSYYYVKYIIKYIILVRQPISSHRNSFLGKKTFSDILIPKSHEDHPRINKR